jgi:hypothetical protein
MVMMQQADSTMSGFAPASARPARVYQPMQQQLPSPSGNYALSSGGSFTSTVSSPFAPFSAPMGYPQSPCNSISCSPLNSSGSTYLGPWISENNLAPAQQQLDSGVLGDQDLAELLLLQQQEAEVDAEIQNLLSLRQQLAAVRQPANIPAAPASLASTFALPVSRSTAALGQQLLAQPQQPPAAAAQVHLASLQVQQHQLQTVEQQLQAQLAEEMVRLLALIEHACDSKTCDRASPERWYG